MAKTTNITTISNGGTNMLLDSLKSLYPIGQWNTRTKKIPTGLDDPWDLSGYVSTIHYSGYLYRFMDKEELNKYKAGTLSDNDRDWHDINPASHNKGYCFFGEDYAYFKDYHHFVKSFNLDTEDDTLRANIQYLLYCEGCVQSDDEYLCKFYYEGEIHQCLGHYGDCEDNQYSIEYGLSNYQSAKLISVRFCDIDLTLD